MTRRLLALAIGLLLAAALVEGTLRLWGAGGSTEEMFGRMGDRVDDPLLEHRGRPGTGENDARGYRNPRALERAEVVALGDSQTWGVNAEIEETWPAVLQRVSGRSVYNMGRGGYGMLQFLVQLDEALDLSPKWIVVALYLGNDLHDAASLAWSLDAHAERRTRDPSLRAALERPERPDPQRMFFDRLAYQRAAAGPLRWLEENTALGRLLARMTRRPADTEADRAWAADHPEEGFVYEGPGISTVFHASYRLAALDRSRPRVREGLRITRDALVDAQARLADETGARMLVLLLPTKERVFEVAVARSGAPAPESYARAVDAEAEIAAALERVLNERRIPYLDLLPALRDAVARGEAVYPPNADGHFTPSGYRVIGEAVARRLESAGD